MEPPQGHVALCVLANVLQNCLHEGPSRSPVGSKTWSDGSCVKPPKLGVDSSFPCWFSGSLSLSHPHVYLQTRFEMDVLKENHDASDFYEQPLGTYDGQAHRDKRLLIITMCLALTALEWVRLRCWKKCGQQSYINLLPPYIFPLNRLFEKKMCCMLTSTTIYHFSNGFLWPLPHHLAWLEESLHIYPEQPAWRVQKILPRNQTQWWSQRSQGRQWHDAMILMKTYQAIRQTLESYHRRNHDSWNRVLQ